MTDAADEKQMPDEIWADKLGDGIAAFSCNLQGVSFTEIATPYVRKDLHAALQARVRDAEHILKSYCEDSTDITDVLLRAYRKKYQEQTP